MRGERTGRSSICTSEYISKYLFSKKTFKMQHVKKGAILNALVMFVEYREFGSYFQIFVQALMKGNYSFAKRRPVPTKEREIPSPAHYSFYLLRKSLRNILALSLSPHRQIVPAALVCSQYFGVNFFKHTYTNVLITGNKAVKIIVAHRSARDGYGGWS